MPGRNDGRGKGGATSLKGNPMYAAEKIEREIARRETFVSGQVLARLMSALERHEEFPLHELYDLSHAHFQLALELLQEWRLARHCGHAIPPRNENSQAPSA